MWNKKVLNQPAETYIYIILPVLVILIAIVIKPDLYEYTLETIKKSIYSNGLIGGWYFSRAISVIYILLMIHLATIIFKSRKSNDIEALRTSLTRIFFSMLYISLILASIVFFISITVGLLGGSAKDNVIAASNLMMEWDMNIFGTYLPFSMQALFNYPVLDTLFMFSYLNLSVVLSSAFLIFFLTSKQLFRSFMLAFTLIYMISIPIWYAFPAISPDEMYRANIFEETTFQISDTEAIENAVIAPSVQSLVDTLAELKTWSRPEDNYYAVTAFPSMHVAWGLLIAYFSYLLWKPLLFLTGPWSVFNLAGSIYSLQHYAVDIIASIVLVVIIILAVRFIMNTNYGRSRNNFSGFYIIDLLQEDIRKYLSFIVPNRLKKCFNR